MVYENKVCTIVNFDRIVNPVCNFLTTSNMIYFIYFVYLNVNLALHIRALYKFLLNLPL